MDDGAPFQPAPLEWRVQEWAKVSKARTMRMEDKLDRILQRLAATPTRVDLLGAFVAALAVLSVVFAGLGWLPTRAGHLPPAPGSPAPIVIQLSVAAAAAPARR